MKSQNKLITIGIPVYNGQNYIKESIQSILQQSYVNLEIVISDNKSSDKTAEICKLLARKDKRIRLFRQKHQLSAINNFNFVLEKARGQYFMWQAADDIRDISALKKLYILLENHSDASLAMSSYKNLYKNKRYFVNKQEHYDNTVSNKNSLIYFITRQHISYLYGLFKTDILKKIGGYHADARPFYKGSDYITVFHTLLYGKAVYTPQVLFLKRETGYFTQKYAILAKGTFDSDLIIKITRYLFSPIYFLFDLFYSLQYLWNSSWNLNDKVTITIIILLSITHQFFKFLYSILKGTYFFLKNKLRL